MKHRKNMYTEICTNLQDHYKGNMPNKVEFILQTMTTENNGRTEYKYWKQGAIDVTISTLRL